MRFRIERFLIRPLASLQANSIRWIEVSYVGLVIGIS